MNEHQVVKDMLAEYTAGTLSPEDGQKVEAHIQHCLNCKAEYEQWRSLAQTVRTESGRVLPPAGLAGKALKRLGIIHKRRTLVEELLLTFQLIKSQIIPVNHDIWIITPLVMAFGVLATAISGHGGLLSLLAPVTVATCIAYMYGSEVNPAFEMEMTAAVSQGRLLFTRLLVVFSFNLFLALIASLIAAPFLLDGTLELLVLSWLGPMTLLSSLAVFLSLFMKTGVILAICYSLWISRFIFPVLSQNGLPFLPEMEAIFNLWSNPWVIIGLSTLFFVLAFWKTLRSEFTRPTSI